MGERDAGNQILVRYVSTQCITERKDVPTELAAIDSVFLSCLQRGVLQ
jgi:hypothetical protein